jgi:hypothetical protein
MSELQTATLEYAASGWPVLPLVPGGKVPLTRHGLKDATADPSQIQQWWRRWPAANIGIVTGPASGLLVVDLDGEKGLATWARLEAEHNALMTLKQMTGSGGLHLLLRYPEGLELGNSAGRLGDGVDTRARGGYIVVPPSVHTSGRMYAWAASGQEIAPTPPWLVALLQPPPRQALPPAVRQPGDDRRQLARFHGLLDLMSAARPRQRNDKLFWCACRLRELLAEGAPPAWIELLVEAGVATGLGEAEVRKTIKSGLGADQR